MTVAVVGSRTFTDRERLFADLDKLLTRHPELTIVTGGAFEEGKWRGCAGADRFAAEWAFDRIQSHPTLTFLGYPPDYARYGAVRGRAEAIRNRAMVEKLDPTKDALLAYWDLRSPGTERTIRMAQKRGVRVWIRSFGPDAE